MKNEDCVFCKIVKGEIPSQNIYEDEKFKAFLDIAPATRGHTLVIPKNHYKTIFDMPENLIGEIMKISQKISITLKERLNADGINIFNSNNKVAQQDIPHYHIHVIPRYSPDSFKFVFNNKTEKKDFEGVKKEILGDK